MIVTCAGDRGISSFMCLMGTFGCMSVQNVFQRRKRSSQSASRRMMPRTIDSLVHHRAKHWGLPPALLQAVVDAEGGLPALVKAVQCSIPDIVDIGPALDITCRSLVHRLADFLLDERDLRVEFLNYFGTKWAPVGVANDPQNLNANWARNANAIYRQLTEKT